jgi:hypothetical protein
MTETHWTPRLVEAYLAEAADTLRRLPQHRIRGYFSTWPEILRDAWETSSCADRPIRLAPSPGAVDQMDWVLPWLRWVEECDRRIVWDRANGRPWKPIASDHGIERTTAWRRWTYALVTIAARLNAVENSAFIHSRQVPPVRG